MDDILQRSCVRTRRSADARRPKPTARQRAFVNTRAAGRGTTTAGIAATIRRRDDRGSRRRAWEARDDAGRDLPTGVHLDPSPRPFRRTGPRR